MDFSQKIALGLIIFFPASFVPIWRTANSDRRGLTLWEYIHYTHIAEYPHIPYSEAISLAQARYE